MSRSSKCRRAASASVAWALAATTLASGAAEALVKRFEFDGATAIPAAELQAVVAPWLAQSASRDGLAQAARAIERRYEAEGLVARVMLPPQDITEGTVHFRVAEARFGRVVVVPGDPVRAIEADRAAGVVAAAQPSQALLRPGDIERATALLNEWPGLTASASLLAGSAPGETDVALSLQDRRPWDASVRLDSEGARATGTARLGFDVNAVVPGGRGQSVALGAVVTEGSQLLRLSGSLPLNDAGWRATAYGSALKYRLVAPEFNSLDVKGPSDTLGASVSWAARRSATGSSDLSLQFERRDFDNRALGTTLSKYHLDVLTLRLAGQATAPNALVQHGYELSLSAGRVDLGGSPNEASDALTARTAGRYGVLRATLQRAQAISPTQTWTARATGQLASANLDVSERLPVTGPSGVRAYPVGEVSGSRALFASTEWQQSLSAFGVPGATLAAFADAGIADPLKTAEFAGAQPKNRLPVAGAGLWVQWAPAEYPVVVRLTLAQPIGAHPNPTPAGTHQDGSRIGTRFWANLQWAL